MRLGAKDNAGDVRIHTRLFGAIVWAVLGILAAGSLLNSFFLEPLLAKALGLRGPGTVRHP